jgi:rubrerythrin
MARIGNGVRAHTQTKAVTFPSRCYKMRSGGAFVTFPNGMRRAVVMAGITMHPRTKQNLMTAIQSEAFTHAMYKHFAERARQEDELGLARVFQRAADSQWTEQFAGELRLTRLRSDTTENLRTSIDDEAELSQMYAQFADEARADGDLRTASLFEKVRLEKAGKQNELEMTLERLGCSSGVRTVPK